MPSLMHKQEEAVVAAIFLLQILPGHPTRFRVLILLMLLPSVASGQTV